MLSRFCYRRILVLFIIAAVLSGLWPYLFFVHCTMLGALLDGIVLMLTLMLIVALTWRDARVIALLLLPLVGLLSYVLYLNYLGML